MSAADFSIRDVMFRRTVGNECDIVVFGETVGSVTRRPDIASPDGGWFYAVHLADDFRGPVLVDDRGAVRGEIARVMVERDLVPSIPPPVHPNFAEQAQRAA